MMQQFFDMKLKVKIFVINIIIIAFLAVVMFTITTIFKQKLSIMTMFFIYLAIFIVYGQIIRFAISRIIVDPLEHIIAAFRQGASGDLNVSLEVGRKDEIGELNHNFNEFVASLRHIIMSMRTSATTVLTSSYEISSGNNQLSSATQEMASSLEQTAASVEEITQSINETCDISVKLSDGITKTADKADRGKEKLQQMEDAIHKVKQSGERIAEIVDLVNAIAFQTNLLALNAAVEAARAGEQGKGFAVVASEVRSLAKRSGDAAAEIKNLVETNEENIANASSISKTTSQILMDVVSNIQNNAAEMKAIENRSREQANGINQINSAIIQMDEVTQRNAALVEELASSAEDMSQISNKLNEEIKKFRLEQEDEPSSQQSAVPSRTIYGGPERRFEKKPAISETPKLSISRPAQIQQKSDTGSESAFFDDDKFEEF